MNNNNKRENIKISYKIYKDCVYSFVTMVHVILEFWGNEKSISRENIKNTLFFKFLILQIKLFSSQKIGEKIKFTLKEDLIFFVKKRKNKFENKTQITNYFFKDFVEFLVEGVPFDGFPSPSVWFGLFQVFRKGYSLCVLFFSLLENYHSIAPSFSSLINESPSFWKTNYHGSHACNLTSPQLPCYVLIWIVP